MGRTKPPRPLFTMGPNRSRTGNRKVDFILSRANEKYRHQGDEFIGLFKKLFIQLCKEDGVI
ncbi:MAG: hypothetical protein CL666_04720 [Balneola sp.]|nr:hypothetical protein [Balneola sp.]|tara:strand:+ start:48235 stop:48420 length:186 start_codon:yes stop_codon:yes gene_type:complete